MKDTALDDNTPHQRQRRRRRSRSFYTEERRNGDERRRFDAAACEAGRSRGRDSPALKPPCDCERLYAGLPLPRGPPFGSRVEPHRLSAARRTASALLAVHAPGNSARLRASVTPCGPVISVPSITPSP